jgi:very-short-patch-repair endonuclease
MHARERAIGEIAGRQDNVITRDQLMALGVGRGAIAHRVATGQWQRLHRAVFLIGPAPPTLSAKARAAVMAMGEGAVLSHRTAAELWGLLEASNEPEVHVMVAGRNVGPRPGLRIHRVSKLDGSEVGSHNDLPVTSPARTVLDLASTAPMSDTEVALAEARIHRLATDRQLSQTIQRHPTAKGASTLRALLEQERDSGYTRSAAERRLRDLVRDAGLPRPRFNEPLLGYVVDALWPEHRLVVEVDGYAYHRHRGAFESDRRRDQELVAAGYRVIRVTWLQLRDRPLSVITSIAQAIARTA